MYELDRVVAVFKPTQVFLDWVKQLPDEENQEVELEDIREDCTTVLIPAVDSPDEADEHIQELFIDIMASELEAWSDDVNAWPEIPDFDTFKTWLDVEYHSMVFDTVEDDEDDEDDDEDYEYEEDDEDDEEYDEYDEDEDDEDYDDDDDDDDEYEDFEDELDDDDEYEEDDEHEEKSR
jgi:hypothetical protein